MINVTVAGDSDGFWPSYYVYYTVIPASALISITVTVLSVVVVIVIYKVRKRHRQTLCRNLERHYEAVDEPVYEMVLSKKSKTGEMSDFNINYNEAYQKIHKVMLH